MTDKEVQRGKNLALLRSAALSFVLISVGLACFPWGLPRTPGDVDTSTYVFAGLLAGAFIIGETGQIHFEFRRRALSVSLSDFPLVIALFILPPWLVIVSRLVGAIAAQAIRRQAPSRIIFNMGLFVAEAGVATGVMAAFAPQVSALSPTSWLPAMGAIQLIDMFGTLAVLVAIAWIDDTRLEPRMFLSTWLSVAVSGALCTALGILVSVILELTVFGAFLLIAVFVPLVVVHRSYHALIKRNMIVDRLYKFTRVGSENATTDDVIAVLLKQSCELLHAERAVLRPAMWASHIRAGHDVSQPYVISRRTTNAQQRAWLLKNDCRDVVMVPIKQGGKVQALLQVSNRLGDISTFGNEDIRVLQTLVAHVEVLWHNSMLVDRLRHDAHHDPLTGLDNRARLLERLDGVLSHGMSLGDGVVPGGLLVALDIRTYRSVHDALGQHVAEMLLVHVASRLDDALPEEAVIARVSEDKFAVFFEGCRTEDESADWIAQIEFCLAESLETQGMVLDSTARMGYALLPEDGATAEDALHNAHVALMAAKRDVRGHSVARFRQEDSDLSLYRLTLASELRRAIAARHISVVYQPKVSAISQRVVGFEALARWDHPVRGLIMPDEFIMLAENTGQLGALTASVMEQALEQASEWGLSYPDIGVAVNLSARQLLDPNLPSMVASMLQRFARPANTLTLEITESRLMSEPEAAQAAMGELRALGVRLSVDDFGTGYSSLSYLQQLPLDEVKIDKSFIFPLAERAQNHAIVQSIIQLAHVLGLSVVAEGVESEEIRDMLAADGCDAVQGYLIGRGMPGAAIVEWLTAWQGSSTPLVLPD